MSLFDQTLERVIELSNADFARLVWLGNNIKIKRILKKRQKIKRRCQKI